MKQHLNFNVRNDPDEESYEFRLPQAIRPMHYDIQIECNWQKMKFRGEETILFKVLQPIDYIAVHARGNLDIITESLHRVDFRLTRHGLDEFHSFQFKKFDYWITCFQSKLNEGEYQLRLRFRSFIDEEQIGLFTSTFLSSHFKKAQQIIATKFTPTFARFTFPCFDEPEMKATFDFTLIYANDPNFMAISNTNVEKTVQLPDNKTEVHFVTTPPMSPHMLAFVISNLDFKAQTLNASATRSFQMRIFTEREKLPMTDYAMDMSRYLLEYLTSFFDFPYPVQKLDLVAIPRLTAGMAEHWGLLYFDETLLLYDKMLNTNANKQRIAMLLVHAMTRMWLGGLVTLTWWDTLWISKGLAAYMEYKSVHKLLPDWGMLDQFLIMELYPAMEIDASHTHPLSKPIEDPSQIPGAFDKISSMKSAAIVRMLEHIVEPQFLRREISKYVAKYAYSNAEAEDFINVLQAGEPEVPIVKIMKTFMEQKGFPFVKVSNLPEKNSFRLAQQRFLSDPEDYQHKLRSAKVFFSWTIPITYVTSGSVEVRHSVFYRHEKFHVLTLPEDQHVQWIKVNKDNIGYYRVNYSSELWRELATALLADPTQFSISDRSQLLSDCFAFANAGLLAFNMPLDLASYLIREKEFVPWYVAVSELKKLIKILSDTDMHQEFLEFGESLFKHLYNKISWTAELPHLDSLLRVTILDAACTFGLPAALNAALELFVTWIKDPEFKILPDLKGIVLLYGMQEMGDSKTWQLVWDRFLETSNAVERRRLLHSLAAVQNSSLLKDLLNLILEPGVSSDEEILKCFHYVSCNVYGRSLVWNYVRKSWPNLMERFGKTDFGLSRLIPTITADFRTHKQLDELQDFIDDNRGKGMSTKARNEAINKIEYNLLWLTRNEATIRSWLNTRVATEESFHTAADELVNSSQSLVIEDNDFDV